MHTYPFLWNTWLYVLQEFILFYFLFFLAKYFHSAHFRFRFPYPPHSTAQPHSLCPRPVEKTNLSPVLFWHAQTIVRHSKSLSTPFNMRLFLFFLFSLFSGSADPGLAGVESCIYVCRNRGYRIRYISTYIYSAYI